MNIQCECPYCEETVWLSKKTLQEAGGENYAGIRHALSDEGWRCEDGKNFCSPECVVSWRRSARK
jgi:hypothetical protein